jgi:hypothetical protein
MSRSHAGQPRQEMVSWVGRIDINQLRGGRSCQPQSSTLAIVFFLQATGQSLHACGAGLFAVVRGRRG